MTKPVQEKLAQPGLREPLAFSRASAYALLFMFVVLALLALGWPELAAAEWNAIFGHGDWTERMDWLLAGLGVFFLWCAAAGPNLRNDLATVAAGIVGGAIIEVWGTRAGLWYYYTGERPPLWILPAWGMSALSNEKLQRFLLGFLPPEWREEILTGERGGVGLRRFYFTLMAFLIGFYLWWSWPAIFHPYTWIVTALLASALLSGRFPAYALSLFFAGALLGIFLEIWGTTRHCWNYYDGKTPSPFPIFGHGMAGLTFWKLKTAAARLLPTGKSAT